MLLIAQYRGPIGPVGGGGGGCSGGDVLCPVVAGLAVLALAIYGIAAFFRFIARPIGKDVVDWFLEYRRASTAARGRLLVNLARNWLIALLFYFLVMVGISLIYNHWTKIGLWARRQTGTEQPWQNYLHESKRHATFTLASLPIKSDGRRLAMADENGISILELTSDVSPTVVTKTAEPVDHLQFLAHSRLVSAHLRVINGQRQHTLRFWDLVGRAQVAECLLNYAVAGLTASSDGKSLVILGEDGTVTWLPRVHTVSGPISPPLKQPREPVGAAVAIVGDTRRIVTGTARGLVSLDEADVEGHLRRLRERDLGMPIGRVAVDRFGDMIALGPVDGTVGAPEQRVHLLDSRSLATVRTISDSGPLAFSHDGQHLIIGAKIYSTSDGTLVQDLQGPGGGVPPGTQVRAAAFTDRGNGVVLVAGDGRVYFFKRPE